jgi:cyclic pyranopterin phosphate synthase
MSAAPPTGRWTRFSHEKRCCRGLASTYGTVEPVDGRDSAPAERFRLEDGTTFGIIASTTEPFLRGNAIGSRLTADGLWLLCLYARGGLDLRRPLREGRHTRGNRAIDHDGVVDARRSRGGGKRLGTTAREPFIPVAALRRDAQPRNAHSRRVTVANRKPGTANALTSRL